MAVFRGIAFPFGKSATAFPATTEDEDLVRQSLQQIVTTARFERVMRPDFGSTAFAFVFENNDDLLAELIQDEVTAAIAKFEPRALVQGVGVQREGNQVLITISYVVALTGAQETLAVTVTTNT